MARNPNTNRNGDAWTAAEIKAVWEKGNPITGYDANSLRSDKCAKVMQYSAHGDRNNAYGWEIDHINPVANGGSDNIGNLQPLNWNNNAAKADKLNWQCGQ